MANETEFKFDRRTVQRYITRGTITEKDYEKHLKALPDKAEKATKLEVEQPASPLSR